MRERAIKSGYRPEFFEISEGLLVMVAREYWEKSNDNDLSNYNDDLLNKTLQKINNTKSLFGTPVRIVNDLGATIVLKCNRNKIYEKRIGERNRHD